VLIVFWGFILGFAVVAMDDMDLSIRIGRAINQFFELVLASTM